jgi:hypothetical protein
MENSPHLGRPPGLPVTCFYTAIIALCQIIQAHEAARTARIAAQQGDRKILYQYILHYGFVDRLIYLYINATIE